MIDTVEPAPGYGISRIIRGGWQQHAAAAFDAAAEADRIEAFMRAGVVAFETSDTYGNVDDALRIAIARRRDLGLPLPRVHARITLPGDVEVSCKAAAGRLGLPCLDLVQLQSWALDETALVDAARRLANLAGEGRLRHVGLMNVDEATLERLLRQGVRPLTLQVQLSLLDRRPLSGLARLAMREGVALLAYGALAGGFIDPRWLGRPDPGTVPGPGDRFHAEYRAIIDAFGGWALFQELLGAVATVAEHHGVAMASVALRWVLDRPCVAATLVGASDPARAQAWGEVFAMRLTAEDMTVLDAVLSRAHGPRGPVGGLERDPSGPMARAIAASRAAAHG